MGPRERIDSPPVPREVDIDERTTSVTPTRIMEHLVIMLNPPPMATARTFAPIRFVDIVTFRNRFIDCLLEAIPRHRV